MDKMMMTENTIIAQAAKFGLDFLGFFLLLRGFANIVLLLYFQSWKTRFSVSFSSSRVTGLVR